MHSTHPQIVSIRAHLKETADRLYEPLVVVVTHSLNLFVVRLDAQIESFKKRVWIVSVIDTPESQTDDNDLWFFFTKNHLES